MLQSRRVRYALLGACLALMIPTTALAQEGTIAGTIRDKQGAVLPGVTVEATGPALIGVRTTVSDDLGQYRITNLPVGTYTVVFTLSGFQRQQRDNIVLTSGFTANVSPVLGVGNFQETVTVTAESPVVDVQNARQAITFSGDQLQELPTSRNIVSLLPLTPGIGSSYRPGTAYGICNGGVGTFCGPAVQGFDQGEELGGSLLTSQGQVKVDGMVLNSNASLTQSVAGGPIVGMLGGYMADIANAQEISIQLSGALGESETGGATINIVPRTGGNRYAGNFNSTYTRNSWFAKNDQAYESLNVSNPVKYNYDVSGAYGGPILRDRLWFYSVARDQGKEQVPGGGRSSRTSTTASGATTISPIAPRECFVYEPLAERQQPLHLAGDAEEQVQHLLGRAELLPGSVPRNGGDLRGARGVVVGAGEAEPPAAVLVDQSVHQPDPAGSKRLDYRTGQSHRLSPGVEKSAGDSQSVRERDDRGR